MTTGARNMSNAAELRVRSVRMISATCQQN
jgi:hypothetical protein